MPLPDRSDRVVVSPEPAALVQVAPGVEQGGIGGVDLLQALRDADGDPVDVGGRVPEVRVVAVLLAQQVRDVQHLPPGVWAGVQQLGRPGVVAGAVDDHEAGPSDQPRVARSRVIVVWVGGGIGDHAGDVRALSAQLGRDAAPEVLGRDDLHPGGRAGRASSAAAACGGSQQRRGYPQESNHQDGRSIPLAQQACATYWRDWRLRGERTPRGFR